MGYSISPESFEKALTELKGYLIYNGGSKLFKLAI